MKVDLPYKAYSIIGKKAETSNIFLFRLKGDLHFEPGQFVQVCIPNIGEATLAPCSDPDNKKHFEVCVKISGTTTKAISELNPGEDMLLRGPFGNGWPYGKLLGKDIVVITGGIGVIPLRPLLYQLDKYSGEFGNVYLLTGCKTPHHLLFTEDKHKAKYAKIIAEKRIPEFNCERGLITELVEKVSLPQKAQVVMCGPEAMYQPVCELLTNKKIPKKNIYVSFERRMECGVGSCQHCSIGSFLVCEDGPVFRWDIIEQELEK